MKILKSNIIYALLLILAVSSCTKIDEELNVNPNNPSDVPTSTLFLNAQRGLATVFWDQWNNGRFGLLYSQYWAQKNYSDESRYLYRTGSVNSFWNNVYSGGLIDLEQIKTLNVNNGLTPERKNDNAMATILQSYYFQMLTDIWGAVPYSDALKGAASSRPSYDSQQDIYVNLIKNVKAAVDALDAGYSSNFGPYDNLYAGDVSSWKKFGNSLLMRLCMRVADRQSEMSSAGVDIKALYEGATSDAISSNSENAKFSFLSSQPNTNPLYVDRVNRGDADFAMSQTLLDLLSGLGVSGDPRVMYFADTAINGGYKGVPYGMSVADLGNLNEDDYSYPSGAASVRTGNSFMTNAVLAPNAPSILMDYAEVCFLNAEAAERGWSVAGAAKDFYDKGVRASMEYWTAGNVTSAQIDDYIASPTVDYNTLTGTWKEKIGVQKWIALYMQGVQGWTEWRRLDFGVLQVPVSGVLDGTGIPSRYAYPTNEKTINESNYTKAVNMQGADDQVTKLWWDVN